MFNQIAFSIVCIQPQLEKNRLTIQPGMLCAVTSRVGVVSTAVTAAETAVRGLGAAAAAFPVQLPAGGSGKGGNRSGEACCRTQDGCRSCRTPGGDRAGTAPEGDLILRRPPAFGRGRDLTTTTRVGVVGARRGRDVGGAGVQAGRADGVEAR